MVDFQQEVEEMTHEGPTTHWIKTSEENKEFLESVGVVLGPREGDYWRLCFIPREAEADLLEHWGSGDEDTIMFDREGGMKRTIDFATRERVYCSLCDSAIMVDGTCSYPLCPSWVVEEEPEVEEEGFTPTQVLVDESEPPKKAARLRQ